LAGEELWWFENNHIQEIQLDSLRSLRVARILDIQYILVQRTPHRQQQRGIRSHEQRPDLWQELLEALPPLAGLSYIRPID
jgi:hypothetical protein